MKENHFQKNTAAVMNILNWKRLLSVKELMAYSGLGRNRAAEWGKEIHAEKRIGRRVFYDRLIVDKAIDSIGNEKQGVAE